MDLVFQATSNINNLIYFLSSVSSSFDFSDNERDLVSEEKLDKKKAYLLTIRVINNIIGLRKAITSDALKYNEKTWYELLKKIIELNNEFHTTENSEIEKELQNRLFYNLTELNKEIVEWNKTHSQKIMTLAQAKEKYKQSLLEGLKYFNY